MPTQALSRALAALAALDGRPQHGDLIEDAAALAARHGIRNTPRLLLTRVADARVLADKDLATIRAALAEHREG